MTGALARVCISIVFLLTCLLRGMTALVILYNLTKSISTHMPLARHDLAILNIIYRFFISTHMPLARHDDDSIIYTNDALNFYSHASCEA